MAGWFAVVVREAGPCSIPSHPGKIYSQTQGRSDRHPEASNKHEALLCSRLRAEPGQAAMQPCYASPST